MIDQFFAQQFVWFTGVVEDRNDPEKMSRVRVRIFGMHTEKKEDLPTEDLPWATVLLPTTSSGNSGIGESPHFLIEGSWVVGFFRDGQSAQDPIIMGSVPSMTEEKRPSSKGFSDPNDTYPIDRYLENPDVNELGREGEHPTIEERDNSITRGVEIARGVGSAWDEPKSAWAGEYTKNHVYETEPSGGYEWGHIREYDDTEGEERIHERHKAGTFYEIDKDGNKVTRVVKDNYEVVLGDNYMNVKGDMNLTVDGNFNLYVKKDFNIQVDQNINTDVGINYIETVEGKQDTFVTGNVDIRGARIDLNVDK